VFCHSLKSVCFTAPVCTVCFEVYNRSDILPFDRVFKTAGGFSVVRVILDAITSGYLKNLYHSFPFYYLKVRTQSDVPHADWFDKITNICSFYSFNLLPMINIILTNSYVTGDSKSRALALTEEQYDFHSV